VVTPRTCVLCARDEAAIECDGCWCLDEAAQPVRLIDRNAERRQELEGAYRLGRADALAELAQSDEWKAMVAWYGEGAWAVLPEWEALVKKVEGGQ
jgi:hypothetical protein